MWEWEPWNSLGAYTDATMDFIFTFVVMELFGGTVSMEPQMRIFRGGGIEGKSLVPVTSGVSHTIS